MSRESFKKPDNIGEIRKIKITKNVRNIVKNKTNLFLPITIWGVIKRPANAFLELVKNEANPIDKRNIILIFLSNKVSFFSRNKAMQNGQMKLNHEPA